MKHNWTKVLLSAAFVSTVFVACKPTPDTDTPFPQAVSPSVIMASQNSFVYALNPETGIKKWECFLDYAKVESSPYLYGGTIFAGNSSSVLFKIDPNTGVRTQSKIGFPSGIKTCPIGKDNFLYISSGSTITSIDIKPDTVEWTFNAGGTINTSPTIRDTQLVFASNDGSVYAIDHRDGKQIWKSASYATTFQSSPTMDSNAVYVGADNFKLYALSRKDGSEIWSYSTEAPVASSPITYGSNVIFGSDDGYLYCLDVVTGLPRWKTKADDRIRSSPFLDLASQTLFVGSYDRGIYAINTLDGTVKWKVTTGGLIASSPVVYKNLVYVGSYDKKLYAIEMSTGKVVWENEINGLMDCSPTIDENNSAGNGINSSISGASLF